MSGQDYFSSVVEGIEFLIATASIIGLLGLLLGLLMIIGGYKTAGIKLFVVCLVIVGITGLFTGVKYFHVH